MAAEPRRRPWRLSLLAVCFLLSGAASLMDQVVWLRYLGLTFGNTTWAAATLLAVFMGGLGLGAWLIGRGADRIRRPLLLYAAFEVGIGVFALASPELIGWIDAAYVAVYRQWGNHPLPFAAGRALLAACFLLPPTLLMGGTLPLVLRATVREGGRVGSRSALFYGINTLGAVAGTALAGFVTIRTIGLYGTLLLAAGANLLAALGVLPLSRPLPPLPRPAVAPAPGSGTRRWLLALFFAMGATSLAYEVLWTRVLVFYLGSSVYAYSLMLLLVLLGIALGSLLATPWADRVGDVLAALAWVEIGIALWIPLQVVLFQHLNAMLGRLATSLAPASFTGVAGVQLLALLPLLGPPTLLMGVSFPLAVRALNRELAAVGADVGRVYGANTLGAVAGSLLAGFALIPAVGTQNALLAIAVGNALLGAWLLRQRSRRLAWGVAAGLPAALVACMLALPPDRVILSAGIFGDDAPGSLVHFHEDSQASVTIRRLPSPQGPYLSLELNGVNVAGTSPDLYAIQKMQGHLPLLLAGDARSVAHIGFGSGGTAWAVSRHPVAEVLIVEISPAVLAASDFYFPHINHGVLSDPRVRVEINDGRNFLLATGERFDALLSDSIHPRYAGNGSLYSREYFQLVRRRLRPGGVASMWLPMYSLTPENYGMILQAFREVFPEMAVWYEPSALNPFTIVSGRLAPGPWDGAALAAAFADPQVAAELADLGIRRPGDLLPLLLGTGATLAPWLDDLPAHRDDLPAVEYESGALLERNLPWLATFARLLELRPEQAPREYLAALPAPERRAAAEAYRQRATLLEAHRDALGRAVRAMLRGE
ncbi:MAG TPA: fused MFS/spermidine synthase [Thermoanaerobaculia bacterium]|nr:fused MFS/spermidine synthase [Thermoanaerobaculia bacterium]